MFKIHSPFRPTGINPRRLMPWPRDTGRKETPGFKGVTGSGKTYTMANIIERVQKPTLVIAHNKTLAYQLASEFREFFLENAVEYFVSYYDYYQPEAYVPMTDTYIEKDSSINDEIDKLRHILPQWRLQPGCDHCWHPFPAYTVWVTRSIMPILWYRCARGS